MARRPTPAFASGGSFQALAIDTEEDQSEPSEGEADENTPPPPPATATARKTAKKKNGKTNRNKNSALTTATSTSTSKPKQQQNNPSSKTATPPTDRKEQPKQNHALKSLTIPPPAEPIETLPLNSDSTPITSPSISTTTSIITSPSTTDYDEQEELPQPDEPTAQHEKLDEKADRANPADRPSDPNPTPTTAHHPSIHSHPTKSPQPSPSPTPTHQSHRLPNPADKSQNEPAEISQFGADHTPGKKWQTVLTRVFWSLVMVTGFITLMALGHLYLIILVFIIQLLVFREVTNLFQVGYKASAREHAKALLAQNHPHHPHHHHHQQGSGSPTTIVKERKKAKEPGHKNRFNKLMSWYFFGVANYFLYGESIIYYFKHIVFIDEYLLPFARHHRFISLLMYLIGFLGFVTNLDRGHLRRQFGLFSWIHMSLLLIIVFGQFMVNNILEGLIWFWVPASLVIMNDVAAYVFGMMFGKHQLIKLSPKKTVEGFVGGFFMTVIFGVLWGSLFMGWNYMICPVKDLGMTAFSEVRCEPNSVFKWRTIEVGRLIGEAMGMGGMGTELVGRVVPTTLVWAPFQLHCLVLATFAGLVAPFGGFFASGFKRAFNVKDFGHTIPGHGGLTDRFDCQFIMGLFTYFYYSSMIKEDDDGMIMRSIFSNNKGLKFSPHSFLQLILLHLDLPQQLQLFHLLQAHLASRSPIPPPPTTS
ncbi:hypothetical protein PtA15_8A76 [Puccinia triticina]|uniref:Phosphatidate cytidylyltransferase n=1 Tax=Puccinia triticina TaxID=208348 RepID=A0ABY7CQ61_9BASI|nr:uncharacterized protein PtA15_8A76 [Puccinia triticina]WAQ87175.1 hypothetical protein PtA15_8A76 [Puccinia triticina]